MGENTSGNFFQVSRKLSLELMGIIGNCENTDENLWEFLVILNNNYSKNFKVTVNLGPWLILGKTISVQR